MLARSLSWWHRCPASGVAFLNYDDLHMYRSLAATFRGRWSTSALVRVAIWQMLEAKEDLAGLHVKFRAGERKGQFTLKLLGAHNASNVLAGLAVALEAGVDLKTAVCALEQLSAGDANAGR